EQDLSPDGAGERAGGAILVGDGIRPPDARADRRDVPPEPRVERHGRAEERRWLDQHLLQPHGPGGEGIQLGADRPEAAVRAAVPPLWAEEEVLRQGLGAAGRREGQLNKTQESNPRKRAPFRQMGVKKIRGGMMKSKRTTATVLAQTSAPAS